MLGINLPQLLAGLFRVMMASSASAQPVFSGSWSLQHYSSVFTSPLDCFNIPCCLLSFDPSGGRLGGLSLAPFSDSSRRALVFSPALAFEHALHVPVVRCPLSVSVRLQDRTSFCLGLLVRPSRHLQCRLACETNRPARAHLALRYPLSRGSQVYSEAIFESGSAGSSRVLGLRSAFHRSISSLSSTVSLGGECFYTLKDSLGAVGAAARITVRDWLSVVASCNPILGHVSLSSESGGICAGDRLVLTALSKLDFNINSLDSLVLFGVDLANACTGSVLRLKYVVGREVGAIYQSGVSEHLSLAVGLCLPLLQPARASVGISLLFGWPQSRV